MAPIVVPAGANQVRVEDSGGTFNVTIPAGIYWGHDDDEATAAGYQGLFRVLAAALNASSLAGTYGFSNAEPSSSSQITGGGIAFLSSVAFTLHVNHADWTLDPRLFGFVAPSSALVAVLDTGVYVAIPPFTSFAFWDCWTIYAERAAVDKRSFPSSNLISSDDDARVSVDAAWDYFGPVKWTRRYRTGFMTAPHVFGARGASAGYAALANLAAGDINNGFFETVWLRARQLDGPTSKAADILIAYNRGCEQLNFSVVADWDVARFARRDQRASLQACFQEVQPNGEIYDSTLEYVLLTRGYDH